MLALQNGTWDANWDHAINEQAPRWSRVNRRETERVEAGLRDRNDGKTFPPVTWIDHEPPTETDNEEPTMSIRVTIRPEMSGQHFECTIIITARGKAAASWFTPTVLKTDPTDIKASIKRANTLSGRAGAQLISVQRRLSVTPTKHAAAARLACALFQQVCCQSRWFCRQPLPSSSSKAYASVNARRFSSKVSAERIYTLEMIVAKLYGFPLQGSETGDNITRRSEGGEGYVWRGGCSVLE